MRGQILRTPGDRFQGVPGFPHSPSYIEDLPGVLGACVHDIDAGPKEADVVWPGQGYST